jgi:hypothetical protein
MPEPENYAIYLKANGDCLVTMPTLRRAFDYVTDTNYVRNVFGDFY